ncbi:MAG TPA: hypothetical protein VF681_03380 [Abditibacteriaceae bacterium]|jgi:hypothetical protein
MNSWRSGNATQLKRTLTNLYNERPPWLANAHAALDRAVFQAYGWPEELADDEILARLLALNSRTGGVKQPGCSSLQPRGH